MSDQRSEPFETIRLCLRNPVVPNVYDAEARAALDLIESELEELQTVLAALLDHAERIQEHVPKSENWYLVRDAARRIVR